MAPKPRCLRQRLGAEIRLYLSSGGRGSQDSNLESPALKTLRPPTLAMLSGDASD
jgi:hypothetical protein